MKHLFVFLLLVLPSSSSPAQEATYWVGRSTHPDPIMRHHEAFMEAFLGYIQSHSKPEHGKVVEQVKKNSPNSHSENLTYDKAIEAEFCRIETVSSVTYEEQEILTIAIGSGRLAKYKYVSDLSESESITQYDIFLTIEYKEGDLESKHEYYSLDIMDSSASNQIPRIIKEFSYNCAYTDAKK